MSIQGTEDIAKEVNTVLQYADFNIISKIPDKFLYTLEKVAQKSNKEVTIDLNKELTEQDISEESKDLIALIYYSYLAEDDEKLKILEKWNENEKHYNIGLEEKYSINNIFKNNQNNNQLIEQTKITKIKQKIYNFFVKIFKRKNKKLKDKIKKGDRIWEKMKKKKRDQEKMTYYCSF